MATEIRVPTLGESVVEATVGQWFKQAGDAVSVDEPLVELETDKVTVEVPAPASGVLVRYRGQRRRHGRGGRSARRHRRRRRQGEARQIESGRSREGQPDAAKQAAAKQAEPAPAKAESRTAPPPIALKELEREPQPREEIATDTYDVDETNGAMPPSPAARKLLAEKGLTPGDVKGSGRRGQVLKGDVTAQAAEALLARARTPKPSPAPRSPVATDDASREERVRMTRLRQTIAKRLKEAQDTAAMLTTFNDVDMSAVMQLRKDYREAFEKKHGVKLGFMGFFVKACVQALKDIPAVNAEIDGEDIVYKNYYHIGVAVGTDRGLVVPVLRDADSMNLAEIEAQIADFGMRARDGKLGLAEMQGGTFTISNGGIYGSMLSTPILNAPQSGILGMHRIEERAVVRDGQIVARPMMYLALSYDHRVVDGKEAVTFLVNVKESLENPARLVLDL